MRACAPWILHYVISRYVLIHPTVASFLRSASQRFGQIRPKKRRVARRHTGNEASDKTVRRGRDADSEIWWQMRRNSVRRQCQREDVEKQCIFLGLHCIRVSVSGQCFSVLPSTHQLARRLRRSILEFFFFGGLFAR